MKVWHWVIIIVLVYLVGVMWPSPGEMVLSKVGLK